MNGNVTLAALLDVLGQTDEVAIVKRMGMNTLEAVAAGTAAELREAECVFAYGNSTVERITVDPGEWTSLIWPGLSRPVLLITIP